ncbi:helix-turn-helix domain-containing protein [Lysinibacillus xylanilyticus]|uniref:helix-turn-helix domain-containing protein n=1 Tax=Lysinibacillus xylanilyticus TaxID=582475 RepID=UPI003D03CD0A
MSHNADELSKLLTAAVADGIKKYQDSVRPKEWMTLKEAALYANVAHNTFVKFRESGLKVAEVSGVKRVSRHEIDTFLQKHIF